MTKATLAERLEAVIRDIDAANADDPRYDLVDGEARPREIVYAERMSASLLLIYPQATETLQIAARAQHVCRWQMPRENYSLGREGYNAWRIACRDHHAAIAADIMARHGYGRAEIDQVRKVIRKENLKTDPESQALENVVGAVFIAFYLTTFVAEHAYYDEAKLLGILTKTFRKMDKVGVDYIKRLDVPESVRRFIRAAE